MTAWQVLRRAMLAGLRVRVSGVVLRVSGPAPALAELGPELRQHKAELLALLETRAKIERNPPDNAEIERMSERMSRACALGFDEDQAEQAADALLIRDRDRDERRCCLECTHARMRAAGLFCALSLSPLNGPMNREHVTHLHDCQSFRAYGSFLTRPNTARTDREKGLVCASGIS